MNILFVHEISWKTKPVIDTHLLAESLSVIGHKVYAIDYENAWKPGEKYFKEETVCRAVTNGRVKLIRPGFIKVPVISRASAWVTHFWAIRKAIKRYKINVIMLYSVPTNGLQAVFWAKVYHLPIYFRSIDVLYGLVQNKTLSKITKAMEGIVYKNVNGVLSISPKLSEYAMAMGCKNAKTLLMPVNNENFYPQRVPDGLYRRWGLNRSQRIILFMGTLYNFSGLDGFIKEFRRVLEQIPEARLLIVGDGIQRAELERIIDEQKVRGQVIITGFQPFSDMPLYINMAEVCINPFKNNTVTDDIFPGKTVQFMACGKVFVSSPLPGMMAVVNGEDEGIIYVRNETLPEELIKLMANPIRINKIGHNGLEYSKKHDCKSVAKELERIILAG